MTSKPLEAHANDGKGCDHCFEPAVYRVAVVAWHGDMLEEIHFCVERFQRLVSEEPERIAGVVNITLPSMPLKDA